MITDLETACCAFMSVPKEMPVDGSRARLVNRSPRVNTKENPSRSSEPVGGPQRPEQRSEVPEQDPSGSTETANSYTVHTKMHQNVLDQSEGLTRDGWRKK